MWSEFFCINSVYFLPSQVLIIREKLADLYESEQLWSKAAQTLGGIDLDSSMRCVRQHCYYFDDDWTFFILDLFTDLIYVFLFRVIDDSFRFSKCVKIASLYLEVF